MLTKQMTERELSLLIKKLNFDQSEETDWFQQTARDGKEQERKLPKRHGRVQVAGNKVIIHDPTDGGNPPVIRAEAPVKLKINDVETKGECLVYSTDLIHWEIEETPLYEITVSEDQLYAYFLLHSKERYAWRLVDAEPATQMVIRAEQDKSIVLETVQLEDVINHMEQLAIKSNPDFAAIQQELLHPSHKPLIIAKGKAPTAGKDAQLEIYFSPHVEKQFFEISGTVDLRNHLNIPSTKRGEVIAKKVPAVQGIPGYDVNGNVLIPALPKDIMINVKPSAELTPGGEVIALKEGRPRITSSGKIKTIDISPSFIVPGDVDITTGNITFSGDVIVYGDVTDHMIIESLGNVYVYGCVYNSTITATGSIYVKQNVIGGKLYSGYFGVMFNRLFHTSKFLCEEMEKLLDAAHMLTRILESKKQTVSFGQVILLLIENKFKDIPSAVKQLISVLANIRQLKKEEYQKLQQVGQVLLNLTMMFQKVTVELIQSFHKMLKDTYQEIERMQEDKVRISFNHCHHSELKSNGDILIYRDGVILSELYSAGNIIFNRESSVCRGSQLDAGDSIMARVVGGQTGANTVLKASKRISIGKMHAGRVCVGKQCVDIYDLVENKTFDAGNIKDGVRE